MTLLHCPETLLKSCERKDYWSVKAVFQGHPLRLKCDNDDAKRDTVFQEESAESQMYRALSIPLCSLCLELCLVPPHGAAAKLKNASEREQNPFGRTCFS
jgi:hypothetical protein